MAAEGNGEHHDVARLGGPDIVGALRTLAESSGKSVRLAGRARADHDGIACRQPALGQSRAEIACSAEDRNDRLSRHLLTSPRRRDVCPISPGTFPSAAPA